MKKININLNQEQKRLFIFGYINFFLGLLVIAINDFITQYFTFELWHKIIIFNGVNIPIGNLSTIIFIVCATLMLIFIIGFDVLIFKQGLNSIKIKEEKTEILKTKITKGEFENVKS